VVWLTRGVQYRPVVHVSDDPSTQPRRRRYRLIIVVAVLVGLLAAGVWVTLAATGRPTALNPDSAGPSVCQPQVIVSVDHDEAIAQAVDRLVDLGGVAAINPQTQQQVWEWYQSWRSDPDRKAMADLIKVEQMKSEDRSAMIWIRPVDSRELLSLATQVRERLGVDPLAVETGLPCPNRASPAMPTRPTS
jgi:hypothetical protein